MKPYLMTTSMLLLSFCLLLLVNEATLKKQGDSIKKDKDE